MSVIHGLIVAVLFCLFVSSAAAVSVTTSSDQITNGDTISISVQGLKDNSNFALGISGAFPVSPGGAFSFEANSLQIPFSLNGGSIRANLQNTDSNVFAIQKGDTEVRKTGHSQGGSYSVAQAYDMPGGTYDYIMMGGTASPGANSVRVNLEMSGTKSGAEDGIISFSVGGVGSGTVAVTARVDGSTLLSKTITIGTGAPVTVTTTRATTTPSGKPTDTPGVGDTVGTVTPTSSTTTDGQVRTVAPTSSTTTVSQGGSTSTTGSDGTVGTVTLIGTATAVPLSGSTDATGRNDSVGGITPISAVTAVPLGGSSTYDAGSDDAGGAVVPAGNATAVPLSGSTYAATSGGDTDRAVAANNTTITSSGGSIYAAGSGGSGVSKATNGTVAPAGTTTNASGTPVITSSVTPSQDSRAQLAVPPFPWIFAVPVIILGIGVIGFYLFKRRK